MNDDTKLSTEENKAIRLSSEKLIEYERKDRNLQYFKYEHLPSHLQSISKPFGDLARKMIEELPSNRQREIMIEKLLEAKDAAVRAMLFVNI